MGKKTANPKREAIRLTELWQKHGPDEYPIDLDKLVDGITSSGGFSDNLTIVKRRFDSIEGSLVRTSGTRDWTILLNTNVKHRRRRRFTFAHELGHFMCHRELRDHFEDSDETLNDFHDRIESEANEFASWLLMPANLIRSEFDGVTWETATLRAIGNRFECSLQASALRFVKLSGRAVAFVVSRDGIILWAVKSEKAPFMTKFCFGDDLPPASQAARSLASGDNGSEAREVGRVWSEVQDAIESQYFDESGLGYQYTCIEFV